MKINAKNLPWIQSLTDIYFFSHHFDLGKRFHNNKHVYSKKRTLKIQLNFPKIHPRIHQYNTLMNTEYINALHVKFSLSEISLNIWKLLLKTFSEYKVSQRPQFVDTFFIVRLKPNMSMRRAVIIN